MYRRSFDKPLYLCDTLATTENKMYLLYFYAIPRKEEVVYMIDSSYLTKAVAPLLENFR